MVDRIGQGSLGKAALEASLRRLQEKKAGLADGATPSGDTKSFGSMIEGGLQAVDKSVKASDSLNVGLLQGKVDFHEIAAQLKQSELSFEFAMQVRNKFIDAYREVMRMSV